MGIDVILCIVAVVLLVLAALNIGAPRVSLGWLGVALFVVALGILPAL